MIIGRGLLATAFENSSLPEDVLIFASGVSNSKETNPDQFRRELDLLIHTIHGNRDKRLVYFSTASVLDSELSDEPYVLHKLNCEELIRINVPNHLILRVTNVVGNSGNPTTVFNFFVEKIRQQTLFELWVNACRNLVDIEDVVRITSALLDEKHTVTPFLLANPTNHPVSELVASLERKLNKKAHYTTVHKGSCASYNLADTLAFYDKIGLSFSNDYLNQLIDRYVR